MDNPHAALYGRYDELSEEALRKAIEYGAQAAGALLIIVGPSGSSGFSASVRHPAAEETLNLLPS